MSKPNYEDKYDGLEEDAKLDLPWPMGCDDCDGTFPKEEVNQCQFCKGTFCDGCWTSHSKSCIDIWEE